MLSFSLYKIVKLHASVDSGDKKCITDIIDVKCIGDL